MRALKKTAAVLLGFAFSLLALEGALRAGQAMEMRSVRARIGAVPESGKRLIAFVGDSNMFGLYVGDDETLPRQIERLAAAGGGTQICTLNLGLPASPSWTVVEQAKKALAYKPGALVARVGINNLSSVPSDSGAGFLENLLIMKMTRRFIFNWRSRNTKPFELPSGVGGEVLHAGGVADQEHHLVFFQQPRDGVGDLLEVERHSTVFPMETVAPRLRSDLEEIVRLCRASNTPLLLATYTAGDWGAFVAVNEVIRDVARSTGTALADCTLELNAEKRRVADGPRPPSPTVLRQCVRGLLVTKDSHPTKLGYALEARVASRELAKLGVLDKLPPEVNAGVVPVPLDCVPQCIQDPADERSFLYTGQPGDRLYLAFGLEGSSRDEAVELPVLSIPHDARISAQVTALADSDGRARFNVTDALWKLVRTPARAAAVATRVGFRGAGQVFVTEPIAVRKRG